VRVLRPPSSHRLVGVDAARGVALLGMVATHVLPLQDDGGSATWPELIASGRSAALFAVLAGVGVALAYGRPRGQAQTRSSAALVVRALLIGVIGLLLGATDSGVAVILAYYAVLFVLVLPWLRAGPRVLLASAAVIAVVVPVVSYAVRDRLPSSGPSSPVLGDLAEPWALLSELLLTGFYPALPWTAYLLLGMGIGRLALHRARVAAVVAGAGALLALLAHGASALLLGPLGGYEQLDASVDQPPGVTIEELVPSGWAGNVPTEPAWWLALDAPHTTTPFDLVATAGTSLLVLGLALLAARRLGTVLLPLAAAGSMPLTLYTVHVLYLSQTSSDDPVRYYLAQVVVGLAAAVLWCRTIGRGPLELGIGRVAGLVRPRQPQRQPLP
jgi:uncharacterized membrane protein